MNSSVGLLFAGVVCSMLIEKTAYAARQPPHTPHSSAHFKYVESQSLCFIIHLSLISSLFYLSDTFLSVFCCLNEALYAYIHNEPSFDTLALLNPMLFHNLFGATRLPVAAVSTTL